MARQPRRTRQPEETPLKFDQKLVLFRWMLKLFDVDSFEKLAGDLRSPDLEGFDADNISRFHHALKARLFEREELPSDTLLRYDQNIVSGWKRITESRNRDGHPIQMKYFQYLSLLFSEVYLDRWFGDGERLLADLNRFVEEFNSGKIAIPTRPTMLMDTPLSESNQVKPYTKEDLNKIAFWCATGSGKTLLMHINILQYRHYLEKNRRERDLNRIILLTPNEGLSLQHLDEFRLSGMEAELFTGEGRGLFAGQSVEIIDIHKLREEQGEKTFAVDAFEGNNLVLVDEGHRGMSGNETGEWMKKRNKLCEQGFSFEYSATFGQTMKASGNKTQEQTYAKCILFDYSYKYFYGDGYGKDYRILNLEDDTDEDIRKRYLTACLLAFYQQQRLFADKRDEFRKFLVESPLWVFVGGSVNAVRTENRRKVSDVVDILLFLSDFTRNREKSVKVLDRLLQGRTELLDRNGRDQFSNVYLYFSSLHLSAEDAYDGILRTLFNATAPASVHIEHLKGTDGEIALRLGENEPFGVVNVGDPSELCKLCKEQDELVVTDREFTGSLFRNLNESDSQVHILIGAKKFSEGWSSWRVSTMGLMNIGKTEGAQIIQLFGRGVRLKGWEFCLKRTQRLPGIAAPKHIELIETLNIFGIHADYMRQFREYLEEEGLPPNDERLQFVMPVVNNLGTKRLKTVRLPDDKDFKTQGKKPTLAPPSKETSRHSILVDWYPQIQARTSEGIRDGEVVEKQKAFFTDRHLAFMDIDRIFFEIEQFKNERAWYNLNIPRDSIAKLLCDHDWYLLLIPKHRMEPQSFEQVRLWEEIAVALLKKYCDRYYKHRKSEWENDFLEYQDLTPDDPNFFEEYLLLIDQSGKDIAEKLDELKAIVTSGQLKPWAFKNIEAFNVSWHLYQPLIYVNSDIVEIKPVVLESPSERDFVQHLKEFCEKSPAFFKERELYVLRNLSRGRGVGFFEAGNFHPDFIVWLIVGKRQFISFVDPKGIRNLEGKDDPKIRFHQTIKSLEIRLGDPQVTLNSYIVSSTPAKEVLWWDKGMTKSELEDCNVLFQFDDKDTYICKLLNKVVQSAAK